MASSWPAHLSADRNREISHSNAPAWTLQSSRRPIRPKPAQSNLQTVTRRCARRSSRFVAGRPLSAVVLLSRAGRVSRLVPLNFTVSRCPQSAIKRNSVALTANFGASRSPREILWAQSQRHSHWKSSAGGARETYSSPVNSRAPRMLCCKPLNWRSRLALNPRRRRKRKIISRK